MSSDSDPQSATDVRGALLIWVASTTVGSERSRLASKPSKARSVFGMYAEATQPAVARVVHDLEDLKGQPEHATLIPVRTPSVPPGLPSCFLAVLGSSAGSTLTGTAGFSTPRSPALSGSPRRPPACADPSVPCCGQHPDNGVEE